MKQTHIKILLFILFVSASFFLTDYKVSAINDVSVRYSTHIQNVGWQNYRSDGATSGTSGKSLRLEGIKIVLSNSLYTGGIEYKTHIQNIGWENSWKNDGKMAGTSGKSLRLEAIKIKLYGKISDYYDVYYRVHVQNFGWLGWAKNGENAGTAGYAYRLEAIEIKLVKKGENPPMSLSDSYIQRYVSYQTHIQNVGWQVNKYDGGTSGTSGKSLRLEAIKIKLSNQEYSGNIEYQTHIQNIGWESSWKKNGEMSGTSGKALRLEAIRIKLTGEMSEYYDVYYRVHAQNFGWLGWAKNGDPAGTQSYAYRLEAIEIKLVKKGEDGPYSTIKPFYKKLISYQSYISGKGYSSFTQDGKTSGIIGNRLEGFKIKMVQTDYQGLLMYSSYVENEGWQDYVSENNFSGTIGQNKKIEAIKVKLIGDVCNYYDLYYRVFISNIGWLSWTSNDKQTGNIGFGNRIEAIEVKLVDKNETVEIDENNIYKENDLKVIYSSYIQNSTWQKEVENEEISGTTGLSKRIEAIKISLNKKIIKGNIEYSTHLSNIGWTSFVKDGIASNSTNNRIEAIKIKLTGDIEQHYDIYYRVHVSNIGWMGWTKNGAPAGTTGEARTIEAYQISLVKKGEEFLGDTTNSYLEAKWITEADGNKYFYNIYGTKVTGNYIINGKTYYFGPTGIYLGNSKLKVIDVSSYQGNIDWSKVASSGIYGVILRLTTSCNPRYEDSKFSTYIEEVKKYNIPYGIYVYSYATSYSDGQCYGNYTKDLISKYNLNPTLGIYLDMEETIENGKTITTAQYTDAFNGFKSYINNAKIYTYLNLANGAMNTEYLRSYITWIAQWDVSKTSYTGNYDMWQYSSKGQISGIIGNVDMNYLYK